MGRPSVSERLALHEELLERLVANQTNLVDLYRSQESNGILFSGTVNVVGTTASTGNPDSWRAVLNFPVPYAGFRIIKAPGDGGPIFVSNYEWTTSSNPPGIGYGVEPTKVTLPGIFYLPAQGNDPTVTALHLAGMTLQIAIPQLDGNGSWANIGLTVYSDPRMVF